MCYSKKKIKKYHTVIKFHIYIYIHTHTYIYVHTYKHMYTYLITPWSRVLLEKLTSKL